jgi:hypothetical protein
MLPAAAEPVFHIAHLYVLRLRTVPTFTYVECPCVEFSTFWDTWVVLVPTLLECRCTGG